MPGKSYKQSIIIHVYTYIFKYVLVYSIVFTRLIQYKDNEVSFLSIIQIVSIHYQSQQNVYSIPQRRLPVSFFLSRVHHPSDILIEGTLHRDQRRIRPRTQQQFDNLTDPQHSEKPSCSDGIWDGDEVWQNWMMPRKDLSMTRFKGRIIWLRHNISNLTKYDIHTSIIIRCNISSTSTCHFLRISGKQNT